MSLVRIYITIYCCQECQGTSSRLLVGQWYYKYVLPCTFLYKYACSYFLYDVYDVKLQLVKSCCRGYPKQNITKSQMPMFITNTKLQYKPKLCFHCTLPLTKPCYSGFTKAFSLSNICWQCQQNLTCFLISLIVLYYWITCSYSNACAVLL